MQYFKPVLCDSSAWVLQLVWKDVCSPCALHVRASRICSMVSAWMWIYACCCFLLKYHEIVSQMFSTGRTFAEIRLESIINSACTLEQDSYIWKLNKITFFFWMHAFTMSKGSPLTNQFHAKMQLPEAQQKLYFIVCKMFNKIPWTFFSTLNSN